MFQTEFEFTLPCGYLDDTGVLHREGIMRLATAADEILPLKDPRVQSNEAYLIVILLSRVVTRLGAADLAFLQNLYNRINQLDAARSHVTCPSCQSSFEMEAALQGGF
jgi:hypothetical protein